MNKIRINGGPSAGPRRAFFGNRSIVLLIGLSLLAQLAPAARGDWTNGANGSWRFAVMGDHRGDNKAFQWVQTPDGRKITNGYTDGGITKAVVTNLARALQGEGVEFVLNVGDLATKWQPTINGCDADTLMSSELGEWRSIWLANSGALPVFPVRGNQEWSAPAETWTRWIKTIPGVGDISFLSPPGEEGLTYAFTFKNCLFVAVDTYAAAISPDSPTITPGTLGWLAELFSASDRPHVFVYGHAPAYEVWDPKKTDFSAGKKVVKDGLPSPARLDAKGAPLTPVMEYDAVTNVRNPFWSLLGDERAGAYFCGHEHLYARGITLDMYGNVMRQVIIGNGGAPPPTRYAPAMFSGDPFIESAAADDPGSRRYLDNWGSPRIALEAFDNLNGSGPAGKYGYVIVEIHGSHATAVYKAERFADDPDGFVELDRWTWKIGR